MTYPIDQSPLYKCSSRRRFADVIGSTTRHLDSLRISAGNYKTWRMKPKESDRLVGIARQSTKPGRMIEEPKGLLLEVHKRIANLLSRIQKPPFVMSATKGKSYLENARAHAAEHELVTIDIKNFYPSISRQKVVRFFRNDLRCSSDVAHLAADLCCHEGHLPTGSPLSPIMSYFACANLFRELSAFARSRNLTFTLYVDDMTFSGPGANRCFAARVDRILADHGLKGHKHAHFTSNATKVVTGVALTKDGTALPFKRQKRIRLFQSALLRAKSRSAIEILAKSLVGQFREAERVEKGSAVRAREIYEYCINSNVQLMNSRTPARRKASRKRMSSFDRVRRATAVFFAMP